MSAAALTKDAPAQAVAGPIVPFVRSSFEHVEPSNFDKSNVIGVNAIQLGPEDVIAYGYLRSLLVYVQATGGTGAAAVYQADAPWSAIQELQLNDVNGAQICGPVTGYDLYVMNLLGAPSLAGAMTDPTKFFEYVTPSAAGNFAFMLRVPVELGGRDALGAIANMNSSSTYKIRVNQAAQVDIYSTIPTTPATMRVRIWAETWAAPQGAGPAGMAMAVQPPALGTTQFWTAQNYPVVNGDNTIQMKRVGNLIRNILVIFRNVTPARTDANLPDPVQLWQDGKLVTNEGLAVRKHYMGERANSGGIAIPAGTLLFDFTHDFDGALGAELRDLWLPTASSTRLELKGIFSAAGTLRVLTNDVVPVGNPFV